MNHQPPSDDELNEFAARADTVPERLLWAAREAFGLREFGARVAELVRDSAFDIAAAAVRRPGLRMLSFESGDVAVECEITAHASRRDIFGQLVGGGASAVDAQVAGQAEITVPVDADGCFGVCGLRPGPVRLRCHLTDGTTLVTSWALI